MLAQAAGAGQASAAGLGLAVLRAEQERQRARSAGLDTPSFAAEAAPQEGASDHHAELSSRPAPDGCVLCGRAAAASGGCGPLRGVALGGRAACVHHLCALWAPSTYQPEGSNAYVNLEAELLRARALACGVCGGAGASVPCAHPGCVASYHLPCALRAHHVVLDQATFQAWCPAHADADPSEGREPEGTPAAPASRPRRQTAGSNARRSRPLPESARSRTDWQKHDDHTWTKVVPPWWCEQRTVHFASRVFKELFQSACSAVIVDSEGVERSIVIQCEARNDLRPQYTLRGPGFAEFWDAAGVAAGRVLCFRRDPGTGKITVSLSGEGAAATPLPPAAAGGGARAGGGAPAPAAGPRALARALREAQRERADTGAEEEEQDASEGRLSLEVQASGTLSAGSLGTGTSSQGGGGGGGRRGRRGAADRGASQQGSHPNRWMELEDGWAIKTVYKSTIVHQQCPIAGWLFKKLYGRLPADSDRAAMHDPDLGQTLTFDVSFISAANVHYITGRAFGGWVRESGLRAGEQVRLRREGGRVLLQRVPADRRVEVEFASKVQQSRSRGSQATTSSEDGAPPAAPPATRARRVASSSIADLPSSTPAPERGAPNPLLASPPAQAALEALDALAAAAGYAGKHGTPAIQAALAQAPEVAAMFATAAMAAVQQQQQQEQQRGARPLEGGWLALAPSPKRHRPSSASPADWAALGLPPPGAAPWPGHPALGAWGPSALPWPPLGPAMQRPQQTPQQQQQQARQQSTQEQGPQQAPAVKQEGAAAPAGAWRPSTAAGQLFEGVMAAVARHAPFTAEEQTALLALRVKCVWLDTAARDVLLVSVRDLAGDRTALLGLLRAAAAAGPGAAPGAAASAQGGAAPGAAAAPSQGGAEPGAAALAPKARGELALAGMGRTGPTQEEERHLLRQAQEAHGGDDEMGLADLLRSVSAGELPAEESSGALFAGLL